LSASPKTVSKASSFGSMSLRLAVSMPWAADEPSRSSRAVVGVDCQPCGLASLSAIFMAEMLMMQTATMTNVRPRRPP
jgi:hypothetical protein